MVTPQDQPVQWHSLDHFCVVQQPGNRAWKSLRKCHWPGCPSAANEGGVATVVHAAVTTVAAVAAVADAPAVEAAGAGAPEMARRTDVFWPVAC
jgi:hypothetical protein